MSTKFCSKCGETKPLDDFGANSAAADGKQFYCRECRKRISKADYAKRSEKIKATRQAYCERDREGINEYNRQNYYKLHEQRRDGRRRQYALNPEPVRRRTLLRRKQIVENGGTYTEEEWRERCEYCNYCCYLCGKQLTRRTVVTEHMIPVTSGGRSDIDNLMPACASCNRKKKNKTLLEYLMTRSLL